MKKFAVTLIMGAMFGATALAQTNDKPIVIDMSKATVRNPSEAVYDLAQSILSHTRTLQTVTTRLVQNGTIANAESLIRVEGWQYEQMNQDLSFYYGKVDVAYTDAFRTLQADCEFLGQFSNDSDLYSGNLTTQQMTAFASRLPEVAETAEAIMQLLADTGVKPMPIQK